MNIGQKIVTITVPREFRKNPADIRNYIQDKYGSVFDEYKDVPEGIAYMVENKMKYTTTELTVIKSCLPRGSELRVLDEGDKIIMGNSLKSISF